MRITYKGDYALKAVLDLSINYGNGVVSMHEMARRLDIPIKFLEQILLDLKRGGFVESRRGKIGGYLSRNGLFYEICNPLVDFWQIKLLDLRKEVLLLDRI